MDEPDERRLPAHCPAERKPVDHLPWLHLVEILDFDGVRPHEDCARLAHFVGHVLRAERLFAHEVEQAPAGRDDLAHDDLCTLKKWDARERTWDVRFLTYRRLSMNKALDRTVEFCQYRLQQAISLCDDEIERLSRRLNFYKSEILDMKQKIEGAEKEIAEGQGKREAQARKVETGIQIRLARIRTEQHQRIQDLQKRNAEEVERLQQSFEETLAGLRQAEEQKLAEKTSAIEGEMKKVLSNSTRHQEEIEEILSTKAKMEEERDEDVEESCDAIIADLQHLLTIRNEERVANLAQSKSKLAQCVDAIEAMERHHTIRVQELQAQLDSIDKAHEENVDVIKRQQQTKMQRLKAQLAEREKSLEALTKASRRLEKENQAQLRQTLNELDRMKFKPSVQDTMEVTEAQKSNLAKLQSEIASLQKELKASEDELDEKRRENEGLKREIGRLKHEISFVGRLK